MSERNSFYRGFGVVLLLDLIPTATFFLMGLTCIIQLAWVIPMALKAHKLNETQRLQGILSAAGLMVLINGICDYSLATGMHNMH